MSNTTPPRPADLMPRELHEMRARWPDPPLSAAAVRRLKNSLLSRIRG